MQNMTRHLRAAALVAFGTLAVSAAAFASDAVQAGITIPDNQRVPVITQNGSGYTPGNYAVGTIHLDYVYVGPSFPVGDFATFTLNLAMYDSVQGGKDTAYPFWLTLADNGSPNLALTPGTSPIQVAGAGWTAGVPVTINIPATVALDADLDDDGDVLTSQLKLSAPGQAHVNSTPTVIVHIRLVHPTTCLKVYDFITDTTFANVVTTTQVNVNRHGAVNSINPYGTLSNNVLVVNTCDLTVESFDLQVSLDPRFSTQPKDNPGNAVVTYTSAGEVDPASFAIGAFGTGTPRGQNLCLTNVSVPGGTSFLAAVHIAIDKPMQRSSLPGGGLAPGVFDAFSASLFTAGSACAGNLVVADPSNPVSASLAFTIQ